MKLNGNVNKKFSARSAGIAVGVMIAMFGGLMSVGEYGWIGAIPPVLVGSIIVLFSALYGKGGDTESSEHHGTAATYTPIYKKDAKPSVQAPATAYVSLYPKAARNQEAGYKAIYAVVELNRDEEDGVE